MPERFQDLLVRPVPSTRSKGAVVLFVGLALVLTLTFSALFATMNSLSTRLDQNKEKVSALQASLDDVSAAQDAGAERGFKIKAVGCATLIVSLRTLDGLPTTCLDPDTLAFYDPASVLAAAVKEP